MALPSPTQLQGITDLTVLAPIKVGLVKGIFESRSYAWRLGFVLKVLDAARHASREAELLSNPFVDGVGRLRGIHFFRFAILPPGDRLLLNVTFDGGWEPYMRLIWGPLGTLLDLIFCHCEGYPLAASSSYDDYIAWVRRNEVPSQFFYADSSGSVADRNYLNRLESQLRGAGDRPGADLRAAQLALEPARPPQATPTAVSGALRSLKGLYGLLPLFGPPGTAANGAVPEDDGSVLLRFAQDLLPDLRDWVADGLFDPGQRFDVLRARFELERQWLMSSRWTRPARRDRRALLDPQLLQAGILQSAAAPEGRHTRGALVLLRVVDAGRARKWLVDQARAKGGFISDGSVVELQSDRVVCTVALTAPGLRALGVHGEHLAALPAEYVQGMEERAGILGDLRCNHPQQWRRPRATATSAGVAALALDLSLVHLVLQLRTCEADDEQTGDRSGLLARLSAWIEQNIVQPDSGCEVLATEAAWSRPRAPAEPAGRDHFDYVDGVSQPGLAPSASTQYWDDEVKTGELLLGWVNDRGDGPLAASGADSKLPTPDWLDQGTFLVVRKIRQYVGRFEAIVEQAAAALVAAGCAPSMGAARELARAKLMGRASDGSPLIAPRGTGSNDFNYRDDPDGAKCPFASHVRRANPRSAPPGLPVPRIVRRGMGYGPASAAGGPSGGDEPDRGVLFMAYNASIAEQFEVIQRWLTGGNSSGVPSCQPDPFLGVPRPGEPGVFRFTVGDKVIRVNLGTEPVCRLEWGLYAFVPSMTTLRTLEALVKRPDSPKAAEVSTEPPAPSDKEKHRQAIKDVFEDELIRGARWKAIRSDKDKPGVEKIGTTVMVGSFEAVMRVLNDDGSSYSVSGYGDRMAATLGGSPFGQDDAAPRGHARPFVGDVKRAIAAAVSEAEAFATAHAVVKARLGAMLEGAAALGLKGASVEMVELGTALIAELCRQWFGVAYGERVKPLGLADNATPVHCPGHLLAVARNVFSAYPNPIVEARASLQGPRLKEAVAGWVADAGKGTAPVMQAVLKAIDASRDAKDISDDERKGTVANVMLGLPATLLGSWLKVLRALAGGAQLWQLQHDLSRLPNQSVGTVSAWLRPLLITTLAADPVADGIWRTVKKTTDLGPVKVAVDDIVWLGLGPALLDKPGDLQAAEDVLFGGAWPPRGNVAAPHACPGRGLAIGALLGGLTAVLQAGEWARTASPTTLSLTRPGADKA